MTISDNIKNILLGDSEIDENKLFQLFYTGGKARSHSTGLELAIVRRLAEKMDESVRTEVKDGMLDIYAKLPLYTRYETFPIHYNGKH